MNLLLHIVIFFAQAVVSVGALLSLFYNVVVSWAIWYFVTSISTYPLAWATCGHEFNTENCFSQYQQDACIDANSTDSTGSPTSYFYNNTCIGLANFCRLANLELSDKGDACSNGTAVIGPETVTHGRTESVEEFWSKNVLGDADKYTWDDFVSPDKNN